MCIGNEPTQTRFRQNLFESLEIGAFRQPNATWLNGKTASIMIASDQNLCAQRWGMLRQQRQQSVGRCACDDFEATAVLWPAKSSDQIPLTCQIKLSSRH